MAFGSLCYVTLQKAKRSLGKLEDTGIRCRFLGFGDNELDDVQNQGYKLLRESDQKVIYSSDVVFTQIIPIEPLNKTSERYVDFYESLIKTYSCIANNEVEPTHEMDDDDFESAKDSTTKKDQIEKHLIEAIDNGHIVTGRGSSEPEMSTAPLICSLEICKYRLKI